MQRWKAAFLVVLCAVVGACTRPHIFPERERQGVDQSFDFVKWKEQPMAYVGVKVEIGGRIVDATETDDGVRIVAAQLPVVEHPIYGPRNDRGRVGAHEFAIMYPGKIEREALGSGNKFVVLGWTQLPAEIEWQGTKRPMLALKATCIHIWKTGPQEIADFPNIQSEYYPLERHTYCAAQ
ncbi:MAG: hypothetical protein KatS3mg082_0794 [Nitrospiraceae bacterium]|nr:MAG: hypothetical protein KatS3mg082_0794 [Nitrospiraceae bacterium]